MLMLAAIYHHQKGNGNSGVPDTSYLSMQHVYACSTIGGASDVFKSGRQRMPNPEVEQPGKRGKCRQG